MKRLLIIILFLASPCSAQYVSMGGFNKGAGGGGGVSSTAIVTHAQGPSTEDGVVSSLISGTTTCAAYTICFPLPDPVLSHNGVVVAYRYHASSAETATVTDDQSNTYTCLTEVHEATHNAFVGGCYSLNLTNSPRIVKVTLNSGCGASGCTQGQVVAGQLYNVTSFDTSATGSNTGSATTLSTSALTTTAGNDLVYHAVFVTNPTNTSVTNSAMPTITFGSGWNGVAAESRDGASAQWKVITSAGSVTPSETASSGVSYASIALAFGSGNQGTLPTGQYVACRWDYNSEESSKLSPTMQLPCAGMGVNFLRVSVNGGTNNTPDPVATSITDSANTWTECGTGENTSSSYAYEFYSNNATASNTESITANLTWGTQSGDVSLWADGLAGTATFGGCPSQNIFTGNAASGAATLSFLTGFQPQASTSITFATNAIQSNTAVSETSPGTAFDSVINGGENLSGPWQSDQNNFRGHYVASGTNAAQTWTQGNTSSSQAVQGYVWGVASYPASTAVFIAQTPVSGQGTSVTDIVINITTVGANDALIVPVGFYNAGSGFTISKVCLDGNSTCSTGTQFTEFTNARSASNSTEPGTGVWNLFSVSKASHTVTIVASGSATNLEGAVYEVANISAQDVANHTNAGTVSGGAASGPSVTSTGNPGFGIAMFGVSNSCTGVASGNAYSAGFNQFSNTQDASQALISTAAAAHSPSCADASGTFNSSNATYK